MNHYNIINYHACIREKEGYTKKKDTRTINIREELVMDSRNPILTRSKWKLSAVISEIDPLDKIQNPFTTDSLYVLDHEGPAGEEV